MKIRLGTRGSALALTQTGIVRSALEERFPGLSCEVTILKTTGDKFLDAPLSQIGVKGLFTKEIEEALLKGEIDLAVHSLKDLATELPEGLKIGAVLPREEARDALVAKQICSLRSIPNASRVGTSSLRRAAQIRSIRPDIRIENIRGNLDTRVRKLAAGDFEAIIAAKAGLNRLLPAFGQDWKDLKINEIPFSEILPAAGQGFLAVEMRSDDEAAGKFVRSLNDSNAESAALCERSFLGALEGGCQVPIGALAQVKGPRIHLEGVLASLDGKEIYRESIEGRKEEAENLGRKLAGKILKMGGEGVLEAVRAQR